MRLKSFRDLRTPSEWNKHIHALFNAYLSCQNILALALQFLCFHFLLMSRHYEMKVKRGRSSSEDRGRRELKTYSRSRGATARDDYSSEEEKYSTTAVREK